MRHGGRRQKEREGQERGTGKKIDHHRRRSRLDVVSSFSDILRRAEETSEILPDSRWCSSSLVILSGLHKLRRHFHEKGLKQSKSLEFKPQPSQRNFREWNLYLDFS